MNSQLLRRDEASLQAACADLQRRDSQLLREELRYRNDPEAVAYYQARRRPVLAALASLEASR